MGINRRKQKPWNEIIRPHEPPQSKYEPSYNTHIIG